MEKNEILSVIRDLYLHDKVTKAEIYEYLNTLDVLREPSSLTEINTNLSYVFENKGVGDLNDLGFAEPHRFWSPKFDLDGNEITDPALRLETRRKTVEAAVKAGGMFYVRRFSWTEYQWLGGCVLIHQSKIPNHIMPNYYLVNENREGVLNFIGLNTYLSLMTDKLGQKAIPVMLKKFQSPFKTDFPNLLPFCKDDAEREEYCAAIDSLIQFFKPHF